MYLSSTCFDFEHSYFGCPLPRCIQREQVQLLVVTRTENSRVVSVYKVKRSNKPNCSSHKTQKIVIENNKKFCNQEGHFFSVDEAMFALLSIPNDNYDDFGGDWTEPQFP